MEHAEVLELIELAALEPGGLERLTAGDTPEAAVVAGHLAGCSSCRMELALIAKSAATAADAIRELPDPALKARTLAFVREVGVDRSGSAPAASLSTSTPASTSGSTSAPVSSSTSPAPEVADQPESLPANVTPIAGKSRRTSWWTAASVAAVVVAGVAGFAAGGAVNGPVGDPVSAMEATKTTMKIAEQPDVAHFALASTTGDMTGGSVIYSVSIGDISMAATGLKPAPNGATYACWVEVDGQRRKIGVMYVEGSDGTWAGWVDGLEKLGPNPIFGVSLVKAGETTGTPILRGGANP